MNENRKQRFGHIVKIAASNAILIAIALGLFAALGLRASGAAAVSAISAVYRGQRGSRAAILISASWDASALEELADTLERANSRATFAFSKSAAEGKTALLARLAASGNELAVMAEQGGEEKTAEALSEELEYTADLIERACGVRPKLAYVGRSDREVRTARALSLIAVRGSIDLLCERGSGEQITSRARGNISGGDIVVCAPTAAFSEAFSDILEYFSRSGLTAATVSGTIYD